MHVMRVNGSQIAALHGHFTQMSSMNVSVTPHMHSADIEAAVGDVTLIAVNGTIVLRETFLNNHDIVQIGAGRFFKLIIPRIEQSEDDDDDDEEEAEEGNMRGGNATVQRWKGHLQNDDDDDDEGAYHERAGHDEVGKTASLTLPFPPPEETPDPETKPSLNPKIGLTLWESSMVTIFSGVLKNAIHDCESQRKHAAHLSVDREMNAIARNYEKTQLMKMDSFKATDDVVTEILYSIDPIDQARFSSFPSHF